jgi:type VI protein secretion system component VasF
VRLAALRREPARAEVMVGYYLALCLGFRGRYAVHGELAWQELVESVRLELERSGAIVELPLAPSGARPRDSIVQRSDGRIVLALGVAVAVVSAVFYAGLSSDLAVRVAGVIGG